MDSMRWSSDRCDAAVSVKMVDSLRLIAEETGICFFFLKVVVEDPALMVRRKRHPNLNCLCDRGSRFDLLHFYMLRFK